MICNAFFAPGGTPLYMGYMGMCDAKGIVFQPFWSEIGYGLCTLVLSWVCYLEELATSSSFGDKTVSLLMFTPTTVYLP